MPGYQQGIGLDVMMECMRSVEHGEEGDDDIPAIPTPMRPIQGTRGMNCNSRILVQTVRLSDVRAEAEVKGENYEFLNSSRFHSCNHWEWAPFRAGSNDSVQVDPKWWASLPIEMRSRIAAVSTVVESTRSIQVPHEREMRKHKCCLQVYEAYESGFEFACWRSLMPEAQLVPLKTSDRRALAATALLRVLSNDEFEADDLEQVSGELLESLDDAIKRVGGKAFVKTANKSAKNDTVLRPHTEPSSILDELTSSRDVLKRSLGSSKTPAKYLVLQPWKDDVTEASELRVIIAGHRIAGISQQKWHKSLGHTKEHAESFVQPVKDLWYKQLLRICPYADCVLDVYVSKGKAHLIEVNPCGWWGSSASGLFQWVRDRDLLLDPSTIPVRVVVSSADSSTITIDPPNDDVGFTGK